MIAEESLQLDLVLAFCAIITLSGCAFIAGRKVCRSERGSVSQWSFVCTILLTLVFCWKFHAKLSWANAIPFSSVVFWSNLAPVMLAFATGMAMEITSLRRSTRPWIVGTLGLLGTAYLVMPIARPWILTPSIAPSDQFNGLVCLQSHDATCAAASAVTLLKLHGIKSSEKEMVRACLTSELGTEALGLYRGLKIASQKHDRSVRLASRNPQQWLSSGQLPNVALVHFPETEFGPIDRDDLSMATVPAKSQFYGDPQQEGHAVVVLGHEDGQWLVADPAIGLVKWSDRSMNFRFTGDAIYISD